MIRTLLAVTALLLASLLPQGTVLCVGMDGHLEVESASADCCPTESDGCGDCIDTASPDLGARPPVAGLPGPAGAAIAATGHLPLEAPRLPEAVPYPPKAPPEAGLGTSVLLI